MLWLIPGTAMEQGDRAMRMAELVAVMDRDLWVTCVAQLELGLL